ncbi:response regulator [Endothiovibrio diazotrophicus]
MKKVLVIDDAATVRLYYRQVLSEERFEVAEAINGLEGLEKALAGGFDLFVVDVNMPKMDGYAFIQHVRREPALQGTPAIMISTEAQERDATLAYAAGANCYLVKPVRPETLTLYARLMTGDRRT